MKIFTSRSTDAARNLDLLLAFAAAGVLGNRLFLVLTGYPKLGGGTLHISHAIWGGLMMIVAVAVAVSSVAPRARLFAAVLGGAGFGWFVDELGKFITTSVNYFFKPTLSLIYVVFVVMYLVFRSHGRRAYRPDEALLNALEALQSAALGELDDAGRSTALALLDGHGPDEGITGGVRALLLSAPTVPVRRPNAYTRVRANLRAATERWAEHPSYPYIFAGLLLLLAINAAVQIAIYAAVGPGVHSLTEWAITVSEVVTVAFVVVGVSLIHRSRLHAYAWLERSLLVSIFVTQVFLFTEAQLLGVVDLTVSLVVWFFLRSAMRVEQARTLPIADTT
jgi:hypothetical protein